MAAVIGENPSNEVDVARVRDVVHHHAAKAALHGDERIRVILVGTDDHSLRLYALGVAAAVELRDSSVGVESFWC